MTRSKSPRLDPRIAATVVRVDADWFQPFDGCRDLQVEYPDEAAVLAATERALALVGASRAHGRAGAAVVAVLASLAAHWIAVPEPTIDALAVVLRLPARDLTKRVGDYASGWLAGDEEWLDQTVALKVIADVARRGVSKATRLAAYDLMAWYRDRGKVPSAPALNAVAVVVGLVDASTRKTNTRLLQLLIGHDPKRLERAAKLDAASLVEHELGNRLSTRALVSKLTDYADDNASRTGADPAYALAVMRSGERYAAVEHREARRLGEKQRTKEQLDALAPKAHARFKNPPAGKRLADLAPDILAAVPLFRSSSSS